VNGYISVQEIQALTGLRSVEVYKAAKRLGWPSEWEKRTRGRPNRLFKRSCVIAWTKENSAEDRRIVDFIAMRDAVDKLDHKPSRKQMEAIARYPFTWADVRSLVETRHYREEAKGGVA
jgi:hypothetical protein